MRADQATGGDQPKLSVVIPCYNEASGLDELVRRVVPVCDGLFPGTYEIVLVNDGSRDATWPIISRHAREHSQIVGINLARNYGHQIALTAVLIDLVTMRRRFAAAGFGRCRTAFGPFFPAFLAKLRPTERMLEWLPLGAQYWIEARKA